MFPATFAARRLTQTLGRLINELGAVEEMHGIPYQLGTSGMSASEFGRELPPENDDWIVPRDVSQRGSKNLQCPHGARNARARPHSPFHEQPGSLSERIQYGFFTLHVQVFLQGNQLWIRPNAKPGEAVRVPTVHVEEKMVDFRYPKDSGVQTNWRLMVIALPGALIPSFPEKPILKAGKVVVEPDERWSPIQVPAERSPCRPNTNQEA